MATLLRPDNSPTGVKTVGCYAAQLGDCDGNSLSAEHYISRNVLQQIGDNVTFQGFPWAEEPRSIGIGAATARILCARHNNALSPLDSAAGEFFRCLVDFHAGDLHGVHQFDGEDIERWMMKVLFGLIASRNAGRHDKQKRRSDPPREFLEVLFWDVPLGLLGLRRGLYFFETPDDPALQANVITFIPKTYEQGHPEAGMLFGLSAVLLGVGLCIAIGTGFSANTGGLVYRSAGLDLGDNAKLDFLWSSAHSGPRIALSLSPT